MRIGSMGLNAGSLAVEFRGRDSESVSSCVGGSASILVSVHDVGKLLTMGCGLVEPWFYGVWTALVLVVVGACES